MHSHIEKRLERLIVVLGGIVAQPIGHCASVNLSTVAHQRVDYRPVPVGDCQLHGCFVVLVALVHVGAMLQEVLHHTHVPLRGGKDQRRPAVVVLGVGADSVLDQEPHVLELPAVGMLAQETYALLLCQRRPAVAQKLGDVVVFVADSLHQRGHTVHIEDGHIYAPLVDKVGDDRHVPVGCSKMEGSPFLVVHLIGIEVVAVDKALEAIKVAF
mmetsp:Transcript_27947/g.79039  ORF Transcript_27947/g.79039 Transcript_27947/m.79039 type:complete len:213 (-) Transcript_27947:7199-7837(-)